MASGCDEFNRFERVLSAASWAGQERQAFEQHAARCAICQAQWIAHAELLQAGPGMEMPALPEDFNSRLRYRLKSDSLTPLPQPGATRWLHGYWVVAALLSLYIVVRTDWPPPLDSPWIPALFVLMILAAVVVEFVPARNARRVAAALGFVDKNPARTSL